MSIDDYIKTVGYAYIYKSLGKTVDEIPLNELTVSLFRENFPRKLMNSIKKYGGTINKAYPGIYYVIGVVTIPTQIIVTSELDGKEHSALKIISKHANEEDVRRFIINSKSYTTQNDINNANAVLQVSALANKELYDQIWRDNTMCQALMEIMSEEVKRREDAAAAEAVSASTSALQSINIRNLMKNLNISADKAMDILEIPTDKRTSYNINLDFQIE
jgi:hypothetical protein